MRTRRFLQFLFAALISLGLAVAPLLSPAVVVGHRTADHGMMHMADMSGDMPCCPDKQKQGDCQDCPLLAICLAKVLVNGPSANGLPLDETASQALRPLDEPALAGLARPPPDQPPRTIV